MAIVNKDNIITIYGRLGWGNLVDWLVTICLGLIIFLTTVSLGGCAQIRNWHYYLSLQFYLLCTVFGSQLIMRPQSD